jgi:hypothetical protein
VSEGKWMHFFVSEEWILSAFSKRGVQGHGHRIK